MHQNIIRFKKASGRETKQPGQKIAGRVGHRPLGHLNEAEEKTNKQKINKGSSFRKIRKTNANEKQKNEEERDKKREYQSERKEMEDGGIEEVRGSRAEDKTQRDKEGQLSSSLVCVVF